MKGGVLGEKIDWDFQLYFMLNISHLFHLVTKQKSFEQLFHAEEGDLYFIPARNNVLHQSRLGKYA